MEKSQGFPGFNSRFQGRISHEKSIENTIKSPLKTLLTFPIKGLWNFHSKIRSIKHMKMPSNSMGS